jgi:roadblock/LC7 domain-containing protein
MACLKTPFPSERAARAALRAVARRRETQRRKEVAVHPCRSCGAWHLTSNVKALGWGARHGRDWGPLAG